MMGHPRFEAEQRRLFTEQRRRARWKRVVVLAGLLLWLAVKTVLVFRHWMGQ